MYNIHENLGFCAHSEWAVPLSIPTIGKTYLRGNRLF